MISLCKSFHTLLGFQDPDYKQPRVSDREISGLLHLIGDPSMPPPSPSPSPPPDRGDPGAWGLHEAALGLCTESLGSESCDTGIIADEDIASRSPRLIRKSRLCQTEDEAGAAAAPPGKKFPPPLSWLSESRGRGSCSFMKGERRDGRLILKEVMIERPEVLLASRQDGRLRLYMIHGINDDDGDEEEEEEEEEVEKKQKSKEEEEEEEERVNLELVGPMRCQDDLNGDGMWWRPNNHRYVTTA